MIQWSFYVERQLPKDIALSVGYVGTHGMHLYGDEFRNYDYVPTAVTPALAVALFIAAAGTLYLGILPGRVLALAKSAADSLALR